MVDPSLAWLGGSDSQRAGSRDMGWAQLQLVGKEIGKDVGLVLGL